MTIIDQFNRNTNLFLASTAITMITGANLPVDGGESLKQSFGDLVDKFRPRKDVEDKDIL